MIRSRYDLEVPLTLNLSLREKKIEKKKAFQAEDFNKVKHQISSLSTKQKE